MQYFVIVNNGISRQDVENNLEENFIAYKDQAKALEIAGNDHQVYAIEFKSKKGHGHAYDGNYIGRNVTRDVATFAVGNLVERSGVTAVSNGPHIYRSTTASRSSTYVPRPAVRPIAQPANSAHATRSQRTEHHTATPPPAATRLTAAQQAEQQAAARLAAAQRAEQQAIARQAEARRAVEAAEREEAQCQNQIRQAEAQQVAAARAQRQAAARQRDADAAEIRAWRRQRQARKAERKAAKRQEAAQRAEMKFIELKRVEKEKSEAKWIKIRNRIIGVGFGTAVASAAYAYEMIPAAWTTAFAAQIGATIITADIALCCLAGIAGVALLVGLYAAHNYLTEEVDYTQDEYNIELRKAKRTLKHDLEKLNSKNKQDVKLHDRFTELMKKAKPKAFDDEGNVALEQPNAADKLMVAQWEHRKLEKLFSLKGNARGRYEAKMLEKAKIKF